MVTRSSPRVTVANTGGRAGREVAQFYVGLPGSRVAPAAAGAGRVSSVNLEPGEQACVEVRLDRADLVLVVPVDDWTLEGGVASRSARPAATSGSARTWRFR